MTDAGGEDTRLDGLLMLCVMRGDEEGVRAALDAGADPNYRLPAGMMSAIEGACRRGYAGIVRLLLERGADLDAGPDVARTCWFFAAAKRHRNVVVVLREAGFRPSLADRISLLFAGRKIRRLDAGSSDAPGPPVAEARALRPRDAAPDQAPSTDPTNPAPAADADAPAASAPDPAEACARLDELFLDSARMMPPEFAGAWDHSEGSIRRLDEAIEAMWGGHPPVQLEQMVMTFGAYLTTTLARCFDGRIDHDEHGQVVVCIPDGEGDEVIAVPFAWVHKRFVNGPEDSLAYKLHVLRTLIAESSPNAAADD